MCSLELAWAWPWWSVMVAINVVNIMICVMVYKRSLSPKNGMNPKYRKYMRIMGVIFTFVGLYRSIFVSKYGPQLGWFDNVANSALLVRLFALAAEISFSILIAFSMLKFNTFLPLDDEKMTNKFSAFLYTKTPYVLVICIIAAQFFATSGVITKSEFLFAVEETLWLIGFLAILPLVISQLRRVRSIKDKEKAKELYMLRRSSLIILIWCLIYIIFMVFLNLPGIWADAIYQLETGIPAIKTDPNSIIDAFTIVNVTQSYGDWGFGFLLWHSGYFTLLVWISIYLMQAPRPRKLSRKLNNTQLRIILILIILSLMTLLIFILLPLIF